MYCITSTIRSTDGARHCWELSRLGDGGHADPGLRTFTLSNGASLGDTRASVESIWDEKLRGRIASSVHKCAVLYTANVYVNPCSIAQIASALGHARLPFIIQAGLKIHTVYVHAVPCMWPLCGDIWHASDHRSA